MLVASETAVVVQRTWVKNKSALIRPPVLRFHWAVGYRTLADMFCGPMAFLEESKDRSVYRNQCWHHIREQWDPRLTPP